MKAEGYLYREGNLTAREIDGPQLRDSPHSTRMIQVVEIMNMWQ